ncbi:citrulline utilization hydrolase CtlX [Elizabethkingia sp. JS20170427COW]|uniref:citrulline utilization hydrolase CtlX n=1 Tax=Elizabethkingia sp. JS20170427COW TaxID=2583851 RepID=UPI0011109B40|nr:arginine deiminase-related protein [Elizabethkingia sp. JS20170427COW]QCX52869.1 amidinotransferase [Elizabethkingia sp. JS20170427COW]
MQSTNTLLMIEPVAFGFNQQTAVNNYFQTNIQAQDTQVKALEEFKNFVEKLRAKDIDVITIQDTLEPHTPDSIFPNNWVSFHQNGTVILYPMFAENRRSERRSDILSKLGELGYQINAIEDYSDFELEEKFLEGTGSMILDREHRIAYGAVSLRLNEEVFKIWCAEFGYQPVIFHAYQTVGEQRLPIYHTNVMMCVATDFAVICLDTLDDVEERNKVVDSLTQTGKTIIEISEQQMHQFAGNMLEVQNKKGEKFLVMSQSAYQSLTQEQIEIIQQYCEIISADLDTIEQNGGGSARCMMAEVFLPKQ